MQDALTSIAVTTLICVQSCAALTYPRVSRSDVPNASVKRSVMGPLPPAIVLQPQRRARCSEPMCSPNEADARSVMFVQFCGLIGMMGRPTNPNGHHVPEAKPAGETQAGH